MLLGCLYQKQSVLYNFVMLKEWSHSGEESCALFHKVRVRACLPVQSSSWSQVSANSPIDRYCFSLVALHWLDYDSSSYKVHWHSLVLSGPGQRTQTHIDTHIRMYKEIYANVDLCSKANREKQRYGARTLDFTYRILQGLWRQSSQAQTMHSGLPLTDMDKHTHTHIYDSRSLLDSFSLSH